MEDKKIVWLEKREYRTLINFDMAASFLGCKENVLTGEMEEDFKEAAELLTANLRPRYMFQKIGLLRGEKEELYADFPTEEFSRKKHFLRMENFIQTEDFFQTEKFFCTDCPSGTQEVFRAKSSSELEELWQAWQKENCPEWEESSKVEEFLSENGLLLKGNSIKEHLGEEEFAVAGCLTLGDGVDLLIEHLEDENLLEATFADALANAAVELLRARLERDAAETFNREFGWLFGIGYGDLPLGLQKDFLWAMDAKKIGLSVTRKMILRPSKSVTGFLNVKKREGDGANCNGKCSICPQRERCQVFKRED